MTHWLYEIGVQVDAQWLARCNPRIPSHNRHIGVTFVTNYSAILASVEP